MLHVLLILVGAIPMPRRDERGTTTVEYALIAGLCVIAMVGGVAALRAALGLIFGGAQTSMDNSVPSSAP